MPVLAERALAGGTDAGLTYLFQRTTGDDPFRRDPRRGSASAMLPRDRGDGETGLERIFSPPAARTWELDGWATVAPDAPDSELDALVGRRRARSSPPGASRGGRSTARRAPSTARRGRGSAPGRTTAARWLEWTGGQPISALTLDPVPRHQAPDAWCGSTASPRRWPTTGRSRSRRRSRGRAGAWRSCAPTGPGRGVGIAEIHGGGRRRRAARRRGQPRVRADRHRVRAPDRPAGRGDDRGLRRRPPAARPRLRAAPAAGGRAAPQPPGGRARALPAAPALGRDSRAPRPGPRRRRRHGDQGDRTASGSSSTHPPGSSSPRASTAAAARRCDGRDLGEPEIGGVYGTAWRVPASCQQVAIAFAPDRAVKAGYAVSLLAMLVLLRW